MSSDDHGIIDYEEVLRVLPESFRDTWKDNPDVLMYLSDLGSLGLQRLNQEPERLAEQKVVVLEQTQDLAFHNYKTFIQAAECSQKIFQDFNIIESRLDLLLSKLPIFSTKCGEFSKDSQKISARWRQASSTLAKHPQLLEFLEMPQLMDNYVKNGYYDEALELSAYVKRLEKKHSDIPLIQSIVDDVKASVNSMLNYLLSKLRTNIQLPECLKVVGYLRRMDVFNEYELRIKFLQARDSWFQKVINEIDKSDSYEHVIKVIESSRIHLFDITTQYRAIFSDDDPLLLVREDLKGNCAIFQSWITWKISSFLRILKSDISTNLSGRIDSVLAQCMYFGLSFSRVNIDFRPLLVPIFQTVALQKFCSSLETAIFKSEKLFESHDFSTYTNTTSLMMNIVEESLQPPLKFLDFYPLAQYCNDVLNALNELKLCFSFAMASDVTSALSKSLKRFVNTIVAYHSKHMRNMTDVEIDNFNKFCFLISSDLIPHFNKCLAILFPPENVSQALGITSLEFKRVEHKLNSNDIAGPLDAILPSKDDSGLIITIKESEPEKILNEENERPTQTNNAKQAIDKEPSNIVSEIEQVIVQKELSDSVSENIKVVDNIEKQAIDNEKLLETEHENVEVKQTTGSNELSYVESEIVTESSSIELKDSNTSAVSSDNIDHEVLEQVDNLNIDDELVKNC